MRACARVLPEGVTPFLSACCSSVVQFIHEGFLLRTRVPPANCQNFAALHTNTSAHSGSGGCCHAHIHSVDVEIVSLVSREAIKSSTKETRTHFFFFAAAVELIPSFSCASSSEPWSRHFTCPFTHNFDTVLTIKLKNPSSYELHIIFSTRWIAIFARLDSLTTLFSSPLAYSCAFSGRDVVSLSVTRISRLGSQHGAANARTGGGPTTLVGLTFFTFTARWHHSPSSV